MCRVLILRVLLGSRCAGNSLAGANSGSASKNGSNAICYHNETDRETIHPAGLICKGFGVTGNGSPNCPWKADDGSMTPIPRVVLLFLRHAEAASSSCGTSYR